MPLGKATTSFRCDNPDCRQVIVAYIWSLCGCGKRCPHCRTLHGSNGKRMLSAAEHRDLHKKAKN